MVEKTKSVEQTVKEIIVGILQCDESALKPETTWKDLEADSLDLVQMLVALEETYGVEISDDDAQNMGNLGDVVNYIEKSVTSKGT